MARPHRLRQIDLEGLIKARSYFRRGYTQAVIAERLGLSTRTVSRYAQLLGFTRSSRSTGISPGETQIISTLQQQIRALSPRAHRVLLAALVEEAA